MSAVKMNGFLQRMLRRSDEELNVDTENEKNDPPRPGSSKGNWIKKLGNYSPSKYKVPSTPTRLNTMRNLDVGRLPGNYTPTSPMKASETMMSTPPQSPKQMPDLETIIHEFEMGFSSPKKHEIIGDTSRQSNFVKKIVAAFEVKYKAYNDMKSEQEAKQTDDKKDRKNQEETHPENTFLESPKRKSKIFASPFKANHDERRSLDKSLTSSPKQTPEEIRSPSRRSGVFSTPTKNTPEAKSPKKPTLFSSPFNRTLTKEDASLTPDRSDFNTSNVSSFFKFPKDDSNRRSGLFFDASTENLPNLDVDLDLTSPIPDETLLLDSTTQEDTILDYSQDEKTFQESLQPDKTPKIVGAFLKRPIAIEDTSIEWIPITGKKLPRKKSLKKLLSALTCKKSTDKKTILFSSARNLNDDSRELQDSGYDEKSCSSSSLTSLISITDVLLQQETSYVEPERRTTLRTFRSKNSLDDFEDEAFSDAYSSARKRKLFLTEVRREDVKLDLGPTYPTSTKLLTMSLDRRSSIRQKNTSPEFSPLTRVPKHPFLSSIPKHPFVSLTKMDEPHGCDDSPDSPTISIKNDLYEVEFRRSCEDFRTPRSKRASSLENEYDVPRRFLSRSETGLAEICRSAGTKKGNEPVYDIPRTCSLERPKSSLYEDALSLKRRTAHLTYTADFYSFGNDAEPYYATIKPRNTRSYFSEDMLRSNSCFNGLEKCSSV